MTRRCVHIRWLGLEASLDLELALTSATMALRTPLAALALWRDLPVLRENRRRAQTETAAPALSPRPGGTRPRPPLTPACPRPARRRRRPRVAPAGAARPRRRPVSC